MKLKNNTLLSLEEAKKRFELEGMTITSWAESRGYKPADVYAVLSGRIKGKHGCAHRIAVDLRLKPDPEDLFSEQIETQKKEEQDVI